MSGDAYMQISTLEHRLVDLFGEIFAVVSALQRRNDIAGQKRQRQRDVPALRDDFSTVCIDPKFHVSIECPKACQDIPRCCIIRNQQHELTL